MTCAEVIHICMIAILPLIVDLRFIWSNQTKPDFKIPARKRCLRLLSTPALLRVLLARASFTNLTPTLFFSSFKPTLSVSLSLAVNIFLI